MLNLFYIYSNVYIHLGSKIEIPYDTTAVEIVLKGILIICCVLVELLYYLESDSRVDDLINRMQYLMITRDAEGQTLFDNQDVKNLANVCSY